MKSKKIYSLFILLFFCIVLISFSSCYWGYKKIKVDGVTRYYRIYVPNPPYPTPTIPVLFALHQFSDTAKGMEKLTQFDVLAEQEKFIVVYPQGTWRRWKTDPLPNEDTRFIEALIQYLSSKYPVDPERIFATGASAGGMMIQAFACFSDRFAGIAPVMGSMTRTYAETRRPTKKIPILIMHGTADPVVPYNGGETYAGPGMKPVFLSAEENAQWWAMQFGCTDEPEITRLPDSNPQDKFYTEVYHYPCEPAVVLYKIYGGGHTWPGNKNWYPSFIVGDTAPEPNASKVIWEFFKSFNSP